MPDEDYGLTTLPHAEPIPAPDLAYLPPRPKNYAPRIALIGCGGISACHLSASRKMDLNLVALCDLDREKVEARREEYYPEASIHTDWWEVVARADIDVIDVATHPEPRAEIIRAALEAGKHVLSQKPFVTDIQAGQDLVNLADRKQVKLAVNQNGRWAPHFSWAKQAIREGLIGKVDSIDFSLHWDHTWTAGTDFENIHHLLLFDFAIHWFDIANAFMGDAPAIEVFAQVRRSRSQQVKPPFLGKVVVDYGDAQMGLSMNALVQFGQEDRSVISGSQGTLLAIGPELNDQKVVLFTEDGWSQPALQGNWFENGFQGTIGELLCAIEEDREPENGARENLRSLELCFAAMHSADTGTPVSVGSIQRVDNPHG